MARAPSSGYDPEPLAEQLSQHTPVPIPYKKPTDWAKIAFMAITALISLATLRFISPILQSRFTWAIITIVTTLVMVSGFMFVRIRGMPQSGQNGQWIAPGYQNQFGQEVQVVSFVCECNTVPPRCILGSCSFNSYPDGLLSASFLMLTLITPHQTSPSRQRLQVYLWSGVIFVMFSVLISLFRVKNRGYPFKLLL